MPSDCRRFTVAATIAEEPVILPWRLRGGLALGLGLVLLAGSSGDWTDDHE